MADLYQAAAAPHQAAGLGPACTQAIAHFRSPHMPHGARYALAASLEPLAKPFVFPSLPALARHIHRARGRDALQLQPARIRYHDRARDVVEVLAEDQAAGRTRRIGFAWIAGADWTALQAALEAQTPSAAIA